MVMNQTGEPKNSGNQADKLRHTLLLCVLSASIFCAPFFTTVAAEAQNDKTQQGDAKDSPRDNPRDNPNNNPRDDVGQQYDPGDRAKRDGAGAFGYDIKTIEPDWAGVRTSISSGEITDFNGLLGAWRAHIVTNARTVQRLARWRLSARRANVPALIPVDDGNAKQASLVSGDTHYAYSARRHDDSFLTITGSCKAHDLPTNHPLVQRALSQRNARPSMAGLNVPYRLTEGEEQMHLRFSKFGCAYEISLTCTNGCAEQTELLQTARRLGVVNPRR